MSASKIASLLCLTTIVASVLSCVAIAVVRSNALVAITVTTLDGAKEPLDHILPLVKQHDALPDYELTLIDDSGTKHYVGSKPNQSAAHGIRWTLDAPVCVSQIAAMRLQERDVINSDQLAEVQITSKTVDANGYQFDFDIKSSFAAGVKSFFETPIGMAISLAFVIAVLYLIVPGLIV